MDWARILAYVTGTVDQQLLARNEYTAVRPATYNTMTLLRSILASAAEKDLQSGDELVKQVKIYPLSKAANPPAQRLLDLSEVMYNGLVNFDETFFTSLSRMLNEETVQPRDLQMMGMLLPLGIEKGKEFAHRSFRAAAMVVWHAAVS